MYVPFVSDRKTTHLMGGKRRYNDERKNKGVGKACPTKRSKYIRTAPWLDGDRPLVSRPHYYFLFHLEEKGVGAAARRPG